MSALSAAAAPLNGGEETAEVHISGIADVNLLRRANFLLLCAIKPWSRQILFAFSACLFTIFIYSSQVAGCEQQKNVVLCERANEKSNLDCGNRRTVDVGVFLLGQPSGCRNLGGGADVALAYRGGIRACQHASSGRTGDASPASEEYPAPSPSIADEARADESKVANRKIYNGVSTGSVPSKFQYLKPFSKEWNQRREEEARRLKAATTICRC